jgi:hypothetical protein
MDCKYCNNQFKNKYALTSHQNKAKYCLIIQGKINKTEGIFKCDICNKILSTKQYLEIHKEKCNGKKQKQYIFTCDYCNNTFSSKQYLELHSKKCEIILEKEEYKCEYCLKIISSKQMLENHKNNCNVKKMKEEQEKKEIILKKDIELKEKDTIITRLKTQNKNYKYQLEKQSENYKEQIKKHEDQIKDLQDKLERIANKAVDKPTTTNNTTNNILNISSVLDFNDINKAKNIIENNLKINDIIYGQKSIALFVKDNLLTDEDGNPIYVCTDPSRFIFKFKNKVGEISRDPEAKKLTDFIVNSGIKIKSATIGNEWCKNEDGNLDMNKFNTIIESQQSILKLKEDNNVFKKELASLTST